MILLTFTQPLAVFPQAIPSLDRLERSQNFFTRLRKITVPRGLFLKHLQKMPPHPAPDEGTGAWNN